MPLFSSTHANDTSIEYRAVESEPMHDVKSHEGHKALGQDVQCKPPSVDVGAVIHTQTGLDSEEEEKGPNAFVGPPVKSWPTTPQRLRGYSVPLLVGDVMLIALPILFIVLSISAWRLDGKTLSETGRTVERAMSLGPTVYPLAFAAIGSRCLRNVVIRLAERGTTVLTLEKLLGSQSLVSAIGTACSLRSANLISIGLLLLWALSPLGGQSSLRLLHETNSTLSENGTVYYSDPAAPIDLDEASWRGIIPTILTASLSTSVEVKYKPDDIWSHPRVPRLDVIENHALQDSSIEGPWVDVDPDVNHTYSSWSGINVQNLRQNEDSAFRIRYNYLYLDQQDLFADAPKTVFDKVVSSYAVFPPLEGVVKDDDSASYAFANITSAGSVKPIADRQGLFLRAAYTMNETQRMSNGSIRFGFSFNRAPISFLYGSSYQDMDNSDNLVYMMYTYTPRIVTVDVEIECHGRDCSVSRLRHVPGEPSSSLEEACDFGAVYRLGCLTTATNAVFVFLRYFPPSIATLLATSGDFERWLSGGNITYVDEGNARPDQITDREKSNRLTTLLNTYWQGSAWGYQITRAAFFDAPDYPWTGDSQSTAPERWINATEAIFSRSVPIYKADVGWIVGLLVISTILLLLGIVNVAFAVMTVAPDLFYYASSLARENPYTKTPDGGTALDGAQRSRMLKDMKVQIADVCPESRVGYVVLKSVDDDDFETGRLRKERLYW